MFFSLQFEAIVAFYIERVLVFVEKIEIKNCCSKKILAVLTFSILDGPKSRFHRSIGSVANSPKRREALIVRVGGGLLCRTPTIYLGQGWSWEGGGTSVRPPPP